MKSDITSADRHSRGRGSASRPTSRFLPLRYEALPPDGWEEDEDRPALQTRFFRDAARSIITCNESPDVGFDAGINPYRGCEHGCIYCYARPSHEYLDLSAGLDFESMIFVKEEAPELLREELSRKSWEPRLLGMSGVTDCYQPIERRLQLTRRCLQVLAEARNPVSLITKSGLVTRDLDVLSELHKFGAVRIGISLTTLNGQLARQLEPRAASPERRLAAIRKLAAAGLPVGVNVAPVIPKLTDEEIPSILAAAAEAGATWAGYEFLRLPHGVQELFTEWLERCYPDRCEAVLARLRASRDGHLNDSRFGSRMSGTGPYAELIGGMFRLAARRHGLDRPMPDLTAKHFLRPGDPRQPTLF